jgi:5-(carboxyamino)imidazole ribonucleotide synthase
VTPIQPGGAIGILGGGQLARMLALEARRMGYRVAVLDPDPEAPGAQVADQHVAGALNDRAAAERLARVSDVVTLDTEHVPSSLLAELAQLVPVRPGPRVLEVIQDRLRQRAFLSSLGAPQVRHAEVSDDESLHAAVRLVGTPAVLKSRRSGYDGRGQAKVTTPADLDAAWAAIGRSPAVMEAFVHFEREVSVLLARAPDGDVRFFPVAENEHRDHVLRTTRVPARLDATLATAACELAAAIAESLGHVGVLAVEYFVTTDGALLVNEIAPRTHNSGHYTFGACATSQFAQHVRAICGLPLGDPSLLRPAVMLNLLGDLWTPGPPSWAPVLSRPAAQLHMYGKARPRPGRKMGHVLVMGTDVAEAAQTIEAIAAELAPPFAAGARPWT